MAAAVAPKAGSAVAAAATAALQAEFGARLRVMRANTVLLQLHAVVRDRETPRERFVFCADQLCQLLLEEAVSALPYAPKVVTTPTGTKYEGLVLTRPVCGVSILRSGEAMEPAFR
jgi:uridine kinase